MPNSCSAPMCQTGYYNDHSGISVFKMPHSPDIQDKWMRFPADQLQAASVHARAVNSSPNRGRPTGEGRPAPVEQSVSCPDASSRSPTYSALRANPFPEVTDPFCRLPLPTLFYRPEALHLGDLLR